VERTRLRLFSLAYAELRHYEDAQDAVAAALLQVCRHVGELREPESIRAWMNSIVRNEVRRLRRGADTAALSVDAETLDGQLWAARGRQDVALTGWQIVDAAPSLLRLDIECALRRLPAEQAQALRLFYLDGVPIREIARRVGCPEGTVKSWLHRGRQLLATQMEEYAPMAPTAPKQTVAIVHTDLEPAFVRKLSGALRAAGYQPKVIKPDDPARVPELVRGYDYIVLDEWIAGRPALEYFLYLRADAEMLQVPVSLVCTDPSELTAAACLVAGVDRLLNKRNLADLDRFRESMIEPVSIPETLPLLAVRDKVYFPGMHFPLFVGRPKSLRALTEARVHGRYVLIVAQKDVVVDHPGPKDLYPMGVAARVTQFLALPDETVRVTLMGAARIRIRDYLQVDPFPRIRGEVLPAEQDASADGRALVQEVVARLEQMMNGKREVSVDARTIADGIIAQLGQLVQQKDASPDAQMLARIITTQLERIVSKTKPEIPLHALHLAQKIEEPGVLADTLTPYLPLTVADQQLILETLPPRERLEKLRALMG
jgi:RNA polymerase sigma factor (sigma-70 family)